MKPKPCKLTLDQTEPIAKAATRAALEGARQLTDAEKERLTLGTLIEDDAYVWELYLAGERPEDAVMICQARVDRLTGGVTVQVFDEWRKPASS
jgi:hypothetical protein